MKGKMINDIAFKDKYLLNTEGVFLFCTNLSIFVKKIWHLYAIYKHGFK
jgi:hypothetical protein